MGAAISRALARRGFAVAVHYSTSQREADELLAELRTAGHTAQAFAADLQVGEAPAKLVDQVWEHFGRLDLLVNSAAVMERTPLGEVSVDEWDRIFALNLRAPFLLSQAAAKRMGQGALIVNMADIAAFETWRGYIPHSVSKAGVVQLTKALAHALAPRIRVNAIAPGVVMLPEGWPPESAARLAATTPLRRTGSADDVTKALEYLIDAEFVTGEVLVVDGGRLVRG